MANLYGFRQGTAYTLVDVANSAPRRDQRSDANDQQRDYSWVKLARASSEISAAVDGQLVSSTVQIVDFDPASSPATMSASGLNTITAWNPHDEAIPADTYLIIGRTTRGWVIIQPLNYCP